MDELPRKRLCCLHESLFSVVSGRHYAEMYSLIGMSVLIVGPKLRWPRLMLPLVSHCEYAGGTVRQTDGRQTVTLRFQLYAADVITPVAVSVFV